MSTLTWQITLGTLFSIVEKIPKWVISKDRHVAKDYFTASYIHSDRRGYHTKLSFYQNENKFDEQISSVSSKKPSFKTINAVRGSVQF